MTNSFPDSGTLAPPGPVDWRAAPIPPFYYSPVPRHPPLKTLVVACALFLLTLCTCLVAGTHFAAAYAQNQAVSWDEFIRALTLLYRQPLALVSGLPFALTLLAILLTHELGHYFACRHHHIHSSYPYFIPFPTLIGTLGAFILIRSPIRTTRALFDVGASGPLIGFVMAVPALIFGILHAKFVPGLNDPAHASIVLGTPLILRLLAPLVHPGIPAGSLLLHPVGRAAWVGLFATSPMHVYESSSFGSGNFNGVNSIATGVFDHVGVSGQHGGAWAGDAVGGSQGLGPNGPGDSYQQAGGSFTVTGSGDIAPVTDGPGSSVGPSGTIEQHLVGTFAGLIAVVVIATMFITAEYRRGMIRLTLAATPRRGRVLAAKAVVIGAVTFVLGLIAAIIAVLIGTRLSANQGIYVFPVSWQTEARVLLGTAALLAVGAVLALAVGTILRRSAAAITAVIAGVVLTYILAMASLVPLPVAEWLLRVTPAAGFAIQQSLPRWPQVTDVYGLPQYYPLSPWAGFAVLCGYAVVAMGLAVLLLRRRDA